MKNSVTLPLSALFSSYFVVASSQEQFRERVVLSKGSTSGHFVARKWKLEPKMDTAIMGRALQFVVMIGTVLTTFLLDFYSEHIFWVFVLHCSIHSVFVQVMCCVIQRLCQLYITR